MGSTRICRCLAVLLLYEFYGVGSTVYGVALGLCCFLITERSTPSKAVPH